MKYTFTFERLWGKNKGFVCCIYLFLIFFFKPCTHLTLTTRTCRGRGVRTFQARVWVGEGWMCVCFGQRSGVGVVKLTGEGGGMSLESCEFGWTWGLTWKLEELWLFFILFSSPKRTKLEKEVRMCRSLQVGFDPMTLQLSPQHCAWTVYQIKIKDQYFTDCFNQ